MKYYLDEDISPKIAELLRKQGVDCISAHEIEMLGASDSEQLKLAARKKQCRPIPLILFPLSSWGQNLDYFIYPVQSLPRYTVSATNEYKFTQIKQNQDAL